jgi:hypothetical protein
LRRLIIWAGLLAMPSMLGLPQPAPPSHYRHDPRLARLRAFFATYRCPVDSLAEDFLAAADHHDLDWRLLPSISLVETGAGKHAPGNNLFGWDSGRRSFASARQAIHLVASRLADSKLYRGKELDAVLATYNPHPGYALLVKSVMRKLGPREALATEARLSLPTGLL